MGKGEMPERVWVTNESNGSPVVGLACRQSMAWLTEYVRSNLYDAACERAERYEKALREIEQRIGLERAVVNIIDAALAANDGKKEGS